MFAGPNGSGKSTIKDHSKLPSKLLGVYINPDELEAAVRADGRLPLGPYGVTAGDTEVRDWFAVATSSRQNALINAATEMSCRDNTIDFGGVAVNSYHASMLAEFLREKLIATRTSFSFETVMSHSKKVELLQDARADGYRTYLYFVATEDPAINVTRVRSRVAQGGHDVPEAKIVERYARSLGLLREAIRHTDRAYFFDNSGAEPWFFAEVTSGRTLEFQSDEMPNWFKLAVSDKF